MANSLLASGSSSTIRAVGMRRSRRLSQSLVLGPWSPVPSLGLDPRMALEQSHQGPGTNEAALPIRRGNISAGRSRLGLGRPCRGLRAAVGTPGQLDRHSCPSRFYALGEDPSTMHLHELLGDAQAQTQPALAE